MGKTSKIVWNDKLTVSGHKLNVTIRFDDGLLTQAQTKDGKPDEARLLNLIYKLTHVTVSKWLQVAAAVNQYQADKTKPDPDVFDKSAEAELFDPPIFADEPLVTVWSFDSPLTLHSHSSPYVAFIMWCAGDAYKKQHEDARRVPAPQAPATIAPDGETPALSTARATDGTQYVGQFVRDAQYPAGQIVEFYVWGIGTAFTKKGQAQWVFRCEYNGAMSQYDTYDLSIYQDNERTPASVREYLESLPLTTEPIEGRWRYVARVAHSKGRQYFNPVKIEPRHPDDQPEPEDIPEPEDMPF